MGFQLARHRTLTGPKGPLVLVVLDGVGIGRGDEMDAVASARTPTLDALRSKGLYRTLHAHGTHVGLPSDGDMGNSEVGHNAMGCGRVYDQGALQVNKALASGQLFEGDVWKQTMARANGGGAVHFLGLLSDGNVHSHIEHLHALLRRAAQEGAKKLFVHALIDGRDVPSDSALVYIDALEAVLGELRAAGITCEIASGGGRMRITMDRYDADWGMVERGYRVHVHGEGRQFASARAAVETYRRDDPSCDDQNLPAFVIGKNGAPVGKMEDGDVVVCFNFRGDRAIEISRAFGEDNFDRFERDAPDLYFAGMMEYDGDTHTPANYLVEPPAIERTMGQYMAENQVSQLAISETQKFGHVTYFWNGNRSGKFDDKSETYIEIASDRAPFEERPWMKAAEITDRLVTELRGGKHRFARVNYANGDMVGHTGQLEATRVAMECMDLQLARVLSAVESMGGALLVTADHGNADEMVMRDKAGRVRLNETTGAPMVKTSHTLNPVPFLLYSPTQRLELRDNEDLPGIANVSATCFEVLGFEAPSDMVPSLIRS